MMPHMDRFKASPCGAARLFGLVLLACPTPPADCEEAAPPPRPSTRPVTNLANDPLPPDAVARMGTFRWRHGEGVEHVAWALDDRRVLSASMNALVLWDSETGDQIRLMGKNSGIAGLAITPDGRQALTGNMLKQMDLWDLESG